jgi:hypothetical protein
VDRREREPELSREDVEAEQPGQTERIFAIGEHKRVHALVPAGSVRTGPNLSLEVATLAPLRVERNLKVRPLRGGLSPLRVVIVVAEHDVRGSTPREATPTTAYADGGRGSTAETRHGHHAGRRETSGPGIEYTPRHLARTTEEAT